MLHEGEEFDTFVQEWPSSEGDQLIAEALEPNSVKQGIYEKFDVPRVRWYQ